MKVVATVTGTNFDDTREAFEEFHQRFEAKKSTKLKLVLTKDPSNPAALAIRVDFFSKLHTEWLQVGWISRQTLPRVFTNIRGEPKVVHVGTPYLVGRYPAWYCFDIVCDDTETRTDTQQ